MALRIIIAVVLGGGIGLLVGLAGKAMGVFFAGPARG